MDTPRSSPRTRLSLRAGYPDRRWDTTIKIICALLSGHTVGRTEHNKSHPETRTAEKYGPARKAAVNVGPPSCCQDGSTPPLPTLRGPDFRASSLFRSAIPRPGRERSPAFGSGDAEKVETCLDGAQLNADRPQDLYGGDSVVVVSERPE